MKLKNVIVIPDVLETNCLYVSHQYSTAVHLCPCGCGQKVVTPFGHPSGWRVVTFANGDATLSPSISNKWCGSHYFIRRNKVEWC